MPPPADPLRETDEEARRLARDLIRGASTVALGVIDPGSGAPSVSRIAIGVLPGGQIVSLISSLALHTRALQADPRASLLFTADDPGRGDPLNQPRLSLSCLAAFIARDSAGDLAMRDAWVAIRPKSKLYVGFGDFSFVVFAPLSGSLNGGFARAYALGPDDLRL